MANIKKSFNFRNGVQVDDDNFIVNPNGLVGIGSTIPTESLDILGNIRLRGILYADSIEADSIINTSDNGSTSFNIINVGITSITSGIISASSGIVTYYGDGRFLQGLPTSQWVDIDSGLGYTSIYSAGNVGIATTNPLYTFQVGTISDGVGITSVGDVIIGRNFYVSGIATINTNLKVSGITTSYSFSGFGTDITGINASNISNGTLDNARLPNNINKTTGIITASSFYGNFVGIASTARNITTDANIDIISIISDYSNLGVATITTLDISNSIGVGTENPNSDFHLRKSSNATIEVTSDSNAAKIVIGREVNNGSLDSFGIIRFGNTDTNQNPQSTQESLDIINYASGNVNYYIRPESTSNLKFNWINYSTNTILASLTPLGKLGIGKTNPNETFEVVGTSTVTNTSYFGSNVYINGSLYPNSLTVSGTSIFNSSVGIKTNSPSYDFQVGGNPNTSNGLSINNDGNLKSSGIITAASFSGSGANLTNINPSNISSGSISGSVNVNTTGIITATSFNGSGTNLTNINPSNISSGSISGSVNVNSTGVVTATSFSGSGTNLTNIRPENITAGNINSNISINSSSGIITAASFNGSGTNLTNIRPENITAGNINSNISINSSSGIITAASFSGSGANLTNIIPENIVAGTISGSVNVNTAGIITAASFSGSGANLTNIIPENIVAGTISGDINVNTVGIVTAESFDGYINPSNITDGLILNTVNFNGSVGIGTTNSLNDFQVNFYSVFTGIGTLSISSGVSTFFESYEIDQYSSAEYLISLNLNSNYQTQKIVVMNNSTTAFSTEHSILFDNKIGSFSVSVSSGEVRLNMLPESGMTGILTYRFVRNSIVSWNP
jgi:hypothetical protein